MYKPIIHIAVIFMLVLGSSIYTTDTMAETLVRQDQSKQAPIIDKLIQIESDIKSIRNNQLNYNIEKNLLKEAYSSSLQTINIVISISLAVFGILGAIVAFAGIKSIITLKREYQNKLNDMHKLGASYETKINSMETRIDLLWKQQESMLE